MVSLNKRRTKGLFIICMVLNWCSLAKSATSTTEPQSISKSPATTKIITSTSASTLTTTASSTTTLQTTTQPHCESPDKPTNGIVTTTSTTVNSTATYSCNVGYTLNGNQNRLCQSTGQWNGSAPNCSINDCESPDKPTNGIVTTTSTTVNSTATYSCNVGYTLNGNQNRLCQSTGQWNGSAPNCSINDCESPDKPTNGIVTTTSTTVNSTATYSCNVGYTLNGNQNRLCQSTGQWNGSAPNCSINDCESPDKPTNGIVTTTSTTVNSTATYSCNVGYTLNGNQNRLCQSTGQWNGSAPNCSINDCGSPDKPSNGNVNNVATTFNSTATYSCNVGYTLNGIGTRMCNATGQWGGTVPICSIKDCESPDKPSNGNVINSTTTFNSTATYTCNVGYTLSGDETRTCKATGQWSGTVPICSINDCRSPDKPSNGNVINSTTTFNSTATYTCNVGYTLSGDETRTCNATGQWSGTVPICSINDCRSPDKPSNGNVINSNTTFNSTATYTCNVGYTLSGDETRTCNATGQWSGTVPICSINDCESPDKPSNGNVINSTTTFNSTATYTCNAGYRLNGDETRTCNATGQWSGTVPICSVKIVGYKKVCYSNGPLGQCNATKNAMCLNNTCECKTTTVYNETVHACVDRIAPNISVLVRGTEELSFSITKGNEPGRVFEVCRVDWECKHVQDVNLTVTFIKLQAGTCYNFNVTVTNDINAETNMAENVCTRPVQITDMQIKSRSANMLEITWSYTAACDIINATIRRKNNYINSTNVTCHNNEEMAYSHSFSQLISSNEYTIQLYATLHDIHSVVSVLTSCTNADQPETCRFAERTNSSVILKWKRGKNRCDYFDINGTAVQCDNDASQHQYSLRQGPLLPGRKYIYPVRAVLNCSGSASTECNICVTTLPPEPTNLKIIDVYNASVSAAWIGTGDVDDRFNLETVNMNHSHDSQHMSGIKSTSNEVSTLIHNLTAASLYQVAVFSVKNDTCLQGGQLNSTLNVSTIFYTRPNTPVVQIRFTNVTTKGFTVEWANDTSVCQSYRVIVESSKDNITNDTRTGGSGSFAVQFYMLQPGTLYRIKLYAVMNNTLLSEAPAEGLTYTVPENIPRPDTINIGNDYITIIRTDEGSQSFHQWHVDIWNEVESFHKMFNHTIMSGTTTGLSTGTEYWIQYYTTVPGRESEKSNISSVLTKTPVVDPETIRVTKITAHNISIEWRPPSTGNSSSYWYDTHFDCTSPNGNRTTALYKTNVTDTTATVYGLDPGSNCTVKIYANVGNQSSHKTEKQLDNKTLETAPEAVSDISASAESSTSIKLVWLEPTIRNGIIRRYDLLIQEYKSQTCEPGVPNNWTLIKCMRRIKFIRDDCDAVSVITARSVSTECNNITNANFSSVNTSFSHVITDLHPYMNYSITVVPYTFTNGNETITSVTTKQSFPSGVPLNANISSVTSATISVKWDKPACGFRNGPITNYTVLYSYYDHICVDELDRTTTKLKKYLTVGANFGNIPLPITDLYSFWDYNISISALTMEGNGSASEPIVQKTAESNPGPVRKVMIDNSTITTEQLSVSWTTPCHPNGVISGYIVQINNTDVSDGMRTYNTNIVNKIITGLLPYRNYTIVVIAKTSAGNGNMSTPVDTRTAIGAPHPPLEVKADVHNYSFVEVFWTKNKYTGPTSYIAHVSNNTNLSCTAVGFEFTSCIIGGLAAFTNYTFTVIAKTKVGSKSSSISGVYLTNETEPGLISSLNVSQEVDVTKPRSIRVSWSPPVKGERHGIITGYVIHVKQEETIRCTVDNLGSNNTCSHPINITCTYSGTDPDKHWTCTLTSDIKTGNYTVTVIATTKIGEGDGKNDGVQVVPGAPIIPLEDEKGRSIVPQADGDSVDDPKRQIAVKFPHRLMCDASNGDPNEWGVVVSEESLAKDKSYSGSITGFKSTIKVEYKTWSQVKDSDKMAPYIATKPNWNPCQSGSGARKRRSTQDRDINFVVGANNDCPDVATERCNGELVPGQSYRVKIYVCTNGGCTETKYSAPLSTEALVNVGLIAGIVSAVVVIVVVLVVLFILRRRQQLCFAKKIDEEVLTHRSGPPTNASEMKDISKTAFNFQPSPVKLIDFPDYVDKLYKDSKMIFSEAYKMLKEESPTHPMTAAEAQSSRPKNRYTNILAYDHSRVKLLPLDDDEDSDYINANYIPGYTSKREYIATQGPMQPTFVDFWRMVWEQNVDTIVMLTKLVEKGRHKCDKYWPDLNEPVYYGDLVVCVQSESHLSDYSIRVIEVKLKATRRIVRQFCYLKWPDMGCPDKPSMLLDFVKSVKEYTKASSANKGPMIVHCSAGVGRTGTFIAVDYLLQYIRDHDEIDIYKLILDMRNQRCNMVQTEDQFVYIHDCMREFITMDDDDEEEDVEPTYMNVHNEENVYENTAFNADM